MKEFIVVIEDEEDILELLEYSLKKEGYDVEGFLGTTHVLQLLNEQHVDLLLVDRNLPGVEGSEFVAMLRQKGIQIPVIFLTAKTEEHHKLEGFERGADDYITKPFSIAEVMMRIKAVLKRTTPPKATLSHRDIIVDMTEQEVWVNERLVELTRKEFDLLCELIRNKNHVLSRESILEKVWGDESFQDRTVDVAIKRLKEKIDPERHKNYIISVRGIGYRLC